MEAFLEGSIAGLSDTIKVSLLSTTYSPNFSTDQYYNIVPSGAIIAAGVALASRTGSAGTLSANNVVFTSVSGSAASYLCIYKDTGTASTSPLIGLIDTATGLPVTPNGGDITVAWSSGQVFTLRKMLSEEARKKPLAWLIDWLRSPGGLWMPEPSLSMA